ncbi:MAG: D-tyrosyl-tRNA(Tyr) deacylase [Thermoleophilia bacterium]|jgi:D-tyrosyl-tRNA(Tyr) deacylase|nr:D-tyrosyl-tRNA(Tyr) deacylase [Thermoleophilia bacterium]
MKCVVQRVSSAKVIVEGDVVGEIGHGLLALVGIAEGDTEAELTWMAEKVAKLRIFDDADGRFDRSLLDVGGSLLSVSQFTLLADVRKGTRPSFTGAAAPDHARPAWERFNELVAQQGIHVATGTFGASMQVELVNDGPVTITLER